MSEIQKQAPVHAPMNQFKTAGPELLVNGQPLTRLAERVGLPVRHRDRTVSRDRAAIIFSRNISVVSDSLVASHTEPVQTPAAPIAMHAAICLPVMIPPAAKTGIFRIGLIARITSGTNTIVAT